MYRPKVSFVLCFRLSTCDRFGRFSKHFERFTGLWLLFFHLYFILHSVRLSKRSCAQIRQQKMVSSIAMSKTCYVQMFRFVDHTFVVFLCIALIFLCWLLEQWRCGRMGTWGKIAPFLWACPKHFCPEINFFWKCKILVWISPIFRQFWGQN